jgi:hypothetical protein
VIVRRTLICALIGGAVAAGAASGASATTVAFTGSCQFAGPIAPSPPITVDPKPGAHFSYRGTGTCNGTLGGATVSAAPITVTFTNVSTAFDTCEFGPDLNLQGQATIGSGAGEALFMITINLARFALAGPFGLTTPGGGQAAGVAQFAPPDAASAPAQCASSGIGTATLSGSFETVAALSGSAVPPVKPAPARPAVRHKHSRARACKPRTKHKRALCSRPKRRHRAHR